MSPFLAPAPRRECAAQKDGLPRAYARGTTSAPFTAGYAPLSWPLFREVQLGRAQSAQ